MLPHKHTHPFYMFFLMMPTGISSGFVTIVLPYLLTQNGFPVAVTAGIVAIGVSANLWRFVWGPVVDVSLSMRKWFWIGLLSGTSMLLLLCFTPFTVKGTVLLTIIVFISQVAGTIIILPVNAIMAKLVKQTDKGKASGWYQAGSLAGTGLGGGAGLWLATHYNVQLSGVVLCATSILFAMVILLIKDIPHVTENTLAHELKIMGKDVVALLKVPVAIYVIILLMSPIGSGASANLWSAIAQEWKTNADTVALVTGIISGLVSTIGCVAGGYIADRLGIWAAYLGSGAVCALVTIIMAALPLTPAVFIGGVLAYTFGIGLINAAFTTVILYAIGKRHVATKFSLLASLGNLPVVYMTTFNGFIHDQYNSRYMLIVEAVIGILFVIVFTLILKRMQHKNLIPSVIE